jgi:hypothetical protein
MPAQQANRHRETARHLLVQVYSANRSDNVKAVVAVLLAVYAARQSDKNTVLVELKIHQHALVVLRVSVLLCLLKPVRLRWSQPAKTLHSLTIVSSF